MSGDENALFGESVDYNQDRIETIGSRKWLDEVHGNGVPRTFGNGELLNGSIGLVTRSLDARADVASTDIAVDELRDSRPRVVPKDEIEGLLTTRMTCKD